MRRILAGVGLISVFLGALFTSVVHAETLAASLSGRILLQVEQHGEAWYVNPANHQRYYLGRPSDAFSLMRDLGVGISNEDLFRIQLGGFNLISPDTDGDGLPDAIEDSFDTNINKADTDGDGYGDLEEVINGYNPNGVGALGIDSGFAETQKGRILLQVEQNGEAWYVNPEDGLRYFLGRPTDAFKLMRDFGLGISNVNLKQIEESATSVGSVPADQEAASDPKIELVTTSECVVSLVSDSLSSCTPHSCAFMHPFTGEWMLKEIVGMTEEGCEYLEQMPNGGVMSCRYSEDMRRAVAQYYLDLAEADSVSSDVTLNQGSGETVTTYMIDGQEVRNPLQEALNNDQCVIVGY
jgi:hypothetical protein